MKNYKLVAVFIGLIIILVGMSFVVNSVLATNQPPCCEQVDDPEEVSDMPPQEESSSHRSSGSYVKKVVKTEYVWEVIKFGDNDRINGNDYVATFQRVLNAQINAGLVVDGIFGVKTQSAWELYSLTLWSIQDAINN